MGKLARVRVDVPNSLDHLWTLDIKKSSASPPRELREALKTLAAQFVKPSGQVQRFRGRRPKDQDGVIRVWDVVVDRDSFRYEVNRVHPVIKNLADELEPFQLQGLENLIEALEQTFPVLDAYNRLSQDATVMTTVERPLDAVAHALRLRPMFADSHPDDEAFVDMLAAVEPYSFIDGFPSALRTALASAKADAGSPSTTGKS